MSDKTADFIRRFCDPLTEPPTWGRDKDLQRIAELEATVARLTAPVTEDEVDRTLADLPAFDDYTSADAAAALTAFLERRMRG